jgi:hypothetical protein
MLQKYFKLNHRTQTVNRTWNIIFIISLVFLHIFAACHKGNEANADTEKVKGASVQEVTESHMKITIGSKTFEATLEDNET